MGWEFREDLPSRLHLNWKLNDQGQIAKIRLKRILERISYFNLRLYLTFILDFVICTWFSYCKYNAFFIPILISYLWRSPFGLSLLNLVALTSIHFDSYYEQTVRYCLPPLILSPLPFSSSSYLWLTLHWTHYWNEACGASFKIFFVIKICNTQITLINCVCTNSGNSKLSTSKCSISPLLRLAFTSKGDYFFRNI